MIRPSAHGQPSPRGRRSQLALLTLAERGGISSAYSLAEPAHLPIGEAPDHGVVNQAFQPPVQAGRTAGSDEELAGDPRPVVPGGRATDGATGAVTSAADVGDLVGPLSRPRRADELRQRTTERYVARLLRNC